VLGCEPKLILVVAVAEGVVGGDFVVTDVAMKINLWVEVRIFLRETPMVVKLVIHGMGLLPFELELSLFGGTVLQGMNLRKSRGSGGQQQNDGNQLHGGLHHLQALVSGCSYNSLALAMQQVRDRVTDC
jgi:hypothetical protein